DLRPRLGRELRRPLQHAGGPRDGAAPQARGPWPAGHPHRARPGLSLRGHVADGVAMSLSLTGRFSALFLAALGLALSIFSTALCVSARFYLDRRVREQLDAALEILAAAAEIHPEGVEWEPEERALPLGRESGPDRLRWLVLDDRGHRVDASLNLAGRDDLARGLARPGGPDRARLVDRRGVDWRHTPHGLGT